MLVSLSFIFNREKEQETQKEKRLMEEKKKKKQEEKKKKEGAQKKVWQVLHCLHCFIVSDQRRLICIIIALTVQSLISSEINMLNLEVAKKQILC